MSPKKHPRIFDARVLCSLGFDLGDLAWARARLVKKIPPLEGGHGSAIEELFAFQFHPHFPIEGGDADPQHGCGPFP